MLSHFSCIQLFVTLWTAAFQAPLSMGFSRQEYWSELPFLLSGDLPDPGFKPVSLMSSALAGRFFITSASWEALRSHHFMGNRRGKRGRPLKQNMVESISCNILL